MAVMRILERAPQKVSGALLLVAGAVILLGIITAEALYPAGYSTSGNEISDLGATRPPHSIIVQPAAAVFDGTMMVSGLLIIVAAYGVYRTFRSWAVTLPLALLGTGVLGVGIFPGNHGTLHPIFAMLAFVAGGIACIVAYRVETVPLRYISMALGAMSLLALVLYAVLGEASPAAVLGTGGVERWVAYPVVVWLVGFGGYLVGRQPRESPTLPREDRRVSNARTAVHA